MIKEDSKEKRKQIQKILKKNYKIAVLIACPVIINFMCLSSYGNKITLGFISELCNETKLSTTRKIIYSDFKCDCAFFIKKKIQTSF